MRRRQFLRFTGLGLAAGMAPFSVAGCAASDSGGAGGRQGGGGADSLAGTVGAETSTPYDAPLSDQVAAAESLGKPVLVLVAPTSASYHLNGRLFGAMLQNGGDPLFRSLAVVHVVCATAEQVSGVSGSPVPPTAPALLIERAGGSRVARVIEAEIAPEPAVALLPTGEESYEDMIARADTEYAVWGDPLADAIVSAIEGDGSPLNARADAVRRTLDPDAAAHVDACLAGNASVTPRVLRRGAAMFRADDIASKTDRWSAALARAARETLVDRRLPGARWATRSGCGSSIDGVVSEHPRPACGMGFCPQAGSRFLAFFTSGN